MVLRFLKGFNDYFHKYDVQKCFFVWKWYSSKQSRVRLQVRKNILLVSRDMFLKSIDKDIEELRIIGIFLYLALTNNIS